MLRKLAFNLWYFQKPPWDTGISPPELEAFVQSHPAGRALDLGCGTGTNVIMLAQHGWRATGVDFARRAIRIARRKAKQAGVLVDLHVDDVTRLNNITGPFDLILDMGCFHNLSPGGKETYTQNMRRLLAPAGCYLLYGFLKEPGDSGTGIGAVDIERLCEVLQLKERQDGADRSGHPSAWFTFERPAVI